MSAVTSVKIGRTPTYLFRKGSIYYFRIAIPIDVRQVFGRTEINYSLQTDDLYQARVKASILSTSIRNLISKARRGDLIMADINVAEFRQRLSDFYTMWFQGLEAGRLAVGRPFTGEELDNRVGEIESTVKEIRQDVASYNHQRCESIVESVLSEMGVEEPRKVEQFDSYCREAVLKFLKLNEVYLDHAKGLYSKEYPWEQPSPETITVREESSILLSEALQLYVEEVSRNWNTKTEFENTAMITNFIAIVGDCPLNLVTREKVRDYKTKLLKFPKNVNKNPKYRDKTIAQIVRMEVPEEDRVSVNTIKNRFSKVSSFLLWLKKQGYPMDEYLTDILSIRNPKRPDEERAVFTPQDLKLIFHSQEYLEDKFNRPEYFWVPILGLFTGARLEEICQLELDDIKEVDGIWCMDINSSGDKSVKTSAGQRMVPLHPFLVEELKIVEYAAKLKKESNKRFFPNLKRNEKNGYSHEVSKWFGRYRKKIGIEDTDHGKKVFHSFRHTFIDAGKQQIGDHYKLAEIVGHESGHDDMTFGRYGKRFTPAILYRDVICKLDFGIDLDHLKKSKFVVRE